MCYNVVNLRGIRSVFMGKTLYLTDLDGTFLHPDAKIGDTSKSIINRLSKEGVLFSISTARTYATVIPMFHEIDLRCPLILMNGVCIYDPQAKKTLIHHKIDIEDGKEVERIFLKHGKNPMLYFENSDNLRVEYKWLENEPQRIYVSARDGFYHKGFAQVDQYSYSGKGDLIYAVTLDRPEEIDQLHKELCSIKGIDWNYYPDTYTGCYFLEGMKAGISKASGAKQVQKLVGADKIVAFGDNRNDIPLFEAADEAYAVGNACDDLKRIATGVIDSCETDAVARFLLHRFENGMI